MQNFTNVTFTSDSTTYDPYLVLYDANNNNGVITSYAFNLTPAVASQLQYGRFRLTLSALPAGVKIYNLYIEKYDAGTNVFTPLAFTPTGSSQLDYMIDGSAALTTMMGAGRIVINFSNSSAAQVSMSGVTMTLKPSPLASVPTSQLQFNGSTSPYNVQLGNKLRVGKLITITKTSVKVSPLKGTINLFKYSINNGTWTTWALNAVITATFADSIRYQVNFRPDERASGRITTPCGQTWSGSISSDVDKLVTTPSGCTSSSNYNVEFKMEAW